MSFTGIITGIPITGTFHTHITTIHGSMIPGIMIPGITDLITTVHTTIIVPLTITHTVTTRHLFTAELILSGLTAVSMKVDGTGILAAVLLQAVQPHSVQVQAVASIQPQHRGL